MKRYYIRTAPYALAEAIAALERNENVRDIRIGMEDGDLTITYEYDKYLSKRTQPVKQELKEEHSGHCTTVSDPTPYLKLKDV